MSLPEVAIQIADIPTAGFCSATNPARRPESERMVRKVDHPLLVSPTIPVLESLLRVRLTGFALRELVDEIDENGVDQGPERPDLLGS